MTSFKEIRFPTDISYGMIGGPEYSTDIVTMASGKEVRNINWSLPRARYNISQNVKTKEQMDKLTEFFRNCQGRAYGFRFKDHTDFEAKDQLIGVGDGKMLIFQLVKSYSSEVRLITKPVKNSVYIYLDAKLTTAKLQYASGKVIFDKAPAEGIKITASFEFDVPVRFDNDSLEASIDDYNSYSWNDISLVEIKG